MIETERLILRPFAEADREAFIDIAADPKVSAWLGSDKTRAEASVDFNRARAFWEERRSGWLAIARKPDGRVVGRVCCRRQPPEWEHPMGEVVELGWALAPDAWGAGYASEAAAAMLPWGFQRFDDAEIFAWTARANLRSQAVMRRIGMTAKPECAFEHHLLAVQDPLRPHVVFARPRDSLG